MNELDTVVLTKDIEQYGLKKGDLGTIVHIYKDNNAIEVEFVTTDGNIVALFTLNASEVRPMVSDEILHVRGFATA